MDLHQTMEQTSHPAHEDGHSTTKQGLLIQTPSTAGTPLVRCLQSARKEHGSIPSYEDRG